MAKAPKKKKLSPEEKERKQHTSEIRSVFTLSGFQRIPAVADKEFTFGGRTGDVDDIFVYENIVVLAEYTCTKSANISTHLLKKKILFDKILGDPTGFIKYLDTKFPIFKERRGDDHHISQYKLRIVYASKNKIDEAHKTSVPNTVYFDYPVMKYFQSVVKAVKKSARFELLNFLGFDCTDIAVKGSGGTGQKNSTYSGSILPEAHSNFDEGFKVVSFYVDPEALLSRTYVLRKDGWREGDGLYQRMISAGKVSAIRKHLKEKKRVFINNIIVTLPSETKLLDDKKNTMDVDKLTKTSPVTIQLPDSYNSIGIIDGQHRVFSYHEGGSFDEDIVKLRQRQNLLVTGIIYPEGIKDIERTKFEANLFLEINSNQTNAKSDLKHAIGLLLTPFSPASIGKQIVNKLNEKGALFDQFERHFYDAQKLKTTSIISYGLIPLIKLGGSDSLFKAWKNPAKETLESGADKELLEEYIKHCTSEINLFLSAVKKIMPSDKWVTERNIKGRLLTTTFINGLLICLRHIVENDKLGDLSYYSKRLDGIDAFAFGDYHSSQYGRMGEEIYKKHFE
ncbi:DGQHR domain-containing protein [Kordiimonas aestuarii]|uniref:DGQHR domain-containing protein n=1 Tax=Kordiimonas aestuarii TaxID=1005925 RepID=UPI0021D0DED9|nr:DGQHR domain-containing protein [Kordiimonas aestuarii]